MVLSTSRLIMISLCICKEVAYVVSATYILPIFPFNMFYSFHMEKKDGIWRLLCKLLMKKHIAPRKSLNFFGMPTIGCTCTHLRYVEPNNIFKGDRLFQQLVCEAWASINQCNLTWVANNQTQLRADLYQELQDRLGHDNAGQDMGQVGRVILPSSHKGGTHYMQQLLQDSLAICREYRKPDLFLTMTANGSWSKITQNLLPGIYIHSICYLSIITNSYMTISQTTVDL